jgi:hypothetical protein
MGHSSYSVSSRTSSARAQTYATASVDQIFTQNKERKAHELMTSKGISIRESVDSEAHPNTVPVQLYLDVTGSMGHIPHEMIKDGLPTLVGSLIQSGIPDVALMFGAIGDHECDGDPLQVAQFESGDEELDMWLTRTYLEGGGGGNNGESYLLAWYFAAFHTKTDAWDKRGQKGFVFTIGDEPNLQSLPISAVKEVMGDTAKGQATYSAGELLAAAQEKNHVYHIFLEHGYRGGNDIEAWKQTMGKNLIVVQDYKDISKIISETILSHGTNTNSNFQTAPSEDAKVEDTDSVEPML